MRQIPHSPTDLQNPRLETSSSEIRTVSFWMQVIASNTPLIAFEEPVVLGLEVAQLRCDGLVGFGWVVLLDVRHVLGDVFQVRSDDGENFVEEFDCLFEFHCCVSSWLKTLQWLSEVTTTESVSFLRRGRLSI